MTIHRLTFAVVEPVSTFDHRAINEWATRPLAPEVEVVCDELGGFHRFDAAGHAVAVLQSKTRRLATAMDGARWSNAVLSHQKRFICGTHDAFMQHTDARRYPVEAAYRLNRRIRWRDFRPRRVRARRLGKPSTELRWRQTVHFCSRGSASIRKDQRPFAACATARKSARPLLIVSSHSAAGSESYTMPAPACT